MNPRLLALTFALGFASSAHAQTYDLRSYFDTLNYSQQQVAHALWTAHFGDQDGSLLPSFGDYTYGYACGTCIQIGQPVNIGDATFLNTPGFASAGLPTFNGVFLHPGPDANSSVAIVFEAQTATWLDGVTILSEAVVNGANGNGIDIAVSHTRDGVSTSLGSYVVSGANLSNQMFSFGTTPLLFAAGDRIEIDVGSNGSYTYDHFNIDVSTTAVAVPVPEADTYALMLVGLSLLGFLARRRASSHNTLNA
jgi:hypothetical protein